MIACESEPGEKYGTTLKELQADYNKLGAVKFAEDDHAFIFDKKTGKPYMWSQYDEALTLYTGERTSEKGHKMEYESKLSKDGKTIIAKGSDTWTSSIFDALNPDTTTYLEYYDLDKKTQTIKEDGEKDVVNKCLFFDLPREDDVILDEEKD